MPRVFSAAYSYFESDMGGVQTISNGKRGYVTVAMYNAGNDKILQFLYFEIIKFWYGRSNWGTAILCQIIVSLYNYNQ